MTSYAACRKATLKDLLESRGGTGGTKNKATLISELAEMDQRDGDAGPRSVEDLFQQRVRERLALYGANPSETAIQNAIRDIQLQDERQERELERQHERRMAEIRQSETTPKDAAPFRKLPFRAFKLFKEGEEEIEAFLQDFERLCQIHEVLPQDWVALLASNLTGRAADAYRALEDEDARDYDRVKEALLARFAITPEASRIKFRESRKQTHITYVEWAHRLQRDLKGWLQGSHAHTIEDITQLVLLEQFFNHTPPVLRDWVRDKRPRTVQKAATLADEYLDSRRSGGSERHPPSRPTLSASNPASAPTPAGTYPQQPRFNSQDYAQPIRCFGCKQLGHKKPDCPLNPAIQSQSWRQPARGSPRTSMPAAHCVEEEEHWSVLHEADPIQAANRDNRQQHRQTVWVNGKIANGLRDSGATMTLLQKNLIPESQHTGDTVAVRVAGGTVFRLPVARVHLDWGVGSGHVNVGVMKDLPADVLMGNDLALLVSAYAPMGPAEANPVTTCAQAHATGTGLIAAANGVRFTSPTGTLDQAQYHSLKLECDKLAREKSEMQRHYVMYYEMSHGLNIEMHKQAEIVKRLNGICAQVLPYLSQEHQQQVLGAIERAKQVTVPELNSLIRPATLQLHPSY